MTIRIYVRASTKDQDATRALNDLHSFADGMNDSISIDYIENESGEDRTRFSGVIRNKSELKKLLKQLGIDEWARSSNKSYQSI